MRWLVENRRLLRNIAVAAVVFAAASALRSTGDFHVPTMGRAQYQAVVLTKRQAYFGRYYDRMGA